MTTDKTTALIEHIAKAIIIARDGKRDGERRFQDPIIKKAYIGDAKAALNALAAFEQPLPSPTKYTDGTYSREYDEQPSYSKIPVCKDCGSQRGLPKTVCQKCKAAFVQPDKPVKYITEDGREITQQEWLSYRNYSVGGASSLIAQPSGFGGGGGGSNAAGGGVNG